MSRLAIDSKKFFSRCRPRSAFVDVIITCKTGARYAAARAIRNKVQIEQGSPKIQLHFITSCQIILSLTQQVIIA